MDFVAKKIDFRSHAECVIIGEIGVNHNGSEELLFKLIDSGIEVGVDIIKLQRFKAEEEISQWTPGTDYQQKSGYTSQLEMAKKLELSDELLGKAYEYCKSKAVGFLCTAFDHSSVEFVANRLKCKSVKVPSPDITNRPLLEHMARSFDGLIVSTGASTLSECADALSWIESSKKHEIALMHCVSEYPAPIDQINLSAMATLERAFCYPTGFSDHTEGALVAIIAASLGAKLIEKHYTLDKSLEGPDHKASADLNELKELIQGVRSVAKARGDGIKQPVACELNNLPLIRKSLTCAVPNIKKGTVITREMIAVKRPLVQSAVQPLDFEKIIGLIINTDKTFDQPFMWSDFKNS